MKFYLTINGAAAVTMESLSMAFTGLDLRNMQADEAGLRWTRRRASDACPIAHNDTVEIFAESRRLFRGRARLGTVTSEGIPIRVVGPWSHLEEQVWQLSLLYGSSGGPAGKVLGDTFTTTWPAGTTIWTGTEWLTLPADHTITWTVETRGSYAGYPATTGRIDVNMGWTARGWLFRPGGTAGQIYTTIQDEWTRLMTYLSTTNNPDLFTVGTVALGNLLAPRSRTLMDAPVSEGLRQALAMKPDAAVWWDYSGPGLPVINARVASLETPLALTIGERVLSNYQLKVSDDLMPSGVVIRWEREASDTTGMGVPYLADFYPGMEVLTSAAVTNGSTTATCASTAGLAVGMMISGSFYIPAGTTVVSITSPTTFVLSAAATGTLSGQRLYALAATGAASYLPGTLVHTVGDETTIVPGVAKEIYTSLAVRRAQGSLTVVDRDFSLGLRPGMTISLAGDAQLTGVQLWVQGVSWSPDTGLAQLTVGYPAHLQLRDRIDLKGWLRAGFSTPFAAASWIVPPP